MADAQKATVYTIFWMALLAAIITVVYIIVSTIIAESVI